MPTETFFNLPPEKREKITELAIEEFSTHSYPQASISAIVSRAGIAKGSFYQYFENKLDLYEWLYLEAARHKLAYIGDPELDAEHFFDWLERMVMAGFRFARDEPRLARLAVSMMEPTSDPELHELHAEHRRQAHEYMFGLLERARKQGALRGNVNTRLAAHVVAQILGRGLVEMIMERAGLDLLEYLNKPEKLAIITDDEIQEIVHGAVEIVRRGIGGEQ